MAKLTIEIINKAEELKRKKIKLNYLEERMKYYTKEYFEMKKKYKATIKKLNELLDKNGFISLIPEPREENERSNKCQK